MRSLSAPVPLVLIATPFGSATMLAVLPLEYRSRRSWRLEPCEDTVSAPKATMTGRLPANDPIASLTAPSATGPSPDTR